MLSPTFCSFTPTTPWPPNGAPLAAPVGGRDDLHRGLISEAIQLIQQLQHGPLHLPDAWQRDPARDILWKMARNRVLPIKNGDLNHSYVYIPEGSIWSFNGWRKF